MLVGVHHFGKLAQGHSVANRQRVVVHRRHLADLEHGASHVDAVDGIGPIEDDDPQAALGGGPHGRVQGRCVGEETRAHVGKIHDNRVDGGRQDHRPRPRGTRRARRQRPTIQAADGKLGFRVDAIFDALVSTGRQAVLGAEQGDESKIAAAGQHVGCARAVARAGAIVGQKRKAQSAQASEVLGRKHVDAERKRRRRGGHFGRHQRGPHQCRNRTREGVDRSLAVGVNAIAQKNHEQVLFRIDPQRGAGVAAVPDRPTRERGSAIGRVGALHVPAQGANATRHVVRRQHFPHGLGRKHAHAVERSVSQHHTGKASEIFRAREQSRVASDAAQTMGARVVNLAAHPSVVALFGRGDART